jgi:hypothetical protein
MRIKIMKLVRIINAVVLLSVLFVVLPGCEKKGSAEKAGQSIDNAVEQAGDKIEEAGDAIKEKTQK